MAMRAVARGASLSKLRASSIACDAFSWAKDRKTPLRLKSSTVEVRKEVIFLLCRIDPPEKAAAKRKRRPKKKAVEPAAGDFPEKRYKVKRGE